ncbi:epoxide hydrolase family protein [Winogradskya consettensis]|nr:epoxide hydrolase family protein [Actinoplanes consettensis]
MNEFRIDVPEAEIDELRRRLTGTRWPDEVDGGGWDYGIPLGRVQQLARRWATDFDWRVQERALNAYPQSVVLIDGLEVHFLHVRSERVDAQPLLLVHGWPGTFAEFRHVIPLLRERFHLVVPSIPGFGFSGRPVERGWGLTRVARAFGSLMGVLGYERFGAHGGDWGSGVVRTLAAQEPERVSGVHVTYLPTVGPVDGLGAEDRARVEHAARYAANRPGYQVLQATRPQTLAYALTDSPVGQLAWIAEKFTEWTDPATIPDDDEILTAVSIYWFTRTAGSSARLTKESAGPAAVSTRVPMGVVVMPHDIVRSVRVLAERNHNVQRWTEFARGGHFAALETPAELAEDIIAFFSGTSIPEKRAENVSVRSVKD